MHVNGLAMKSCTMLALQGEGADVTTMRASPHRARHSIPCRPLFGAPCAPCGYCTPGMVMIALDIVRRFGEPDEVTIREQLKGNICRCTGYHNIVEAIAAGARAMTAQPA